MSKITVGKLRELAKGTSKEKIFDYNGFKIKLKTYLPILDKINFVSYIYQFSIDEENFNVVDHNSLDISFKTRFVEVYTDIKLPENIIDGYNLIMSTGLFNLVYNNLPECEKEELQQVLDNYINKKQDIYERENSISNVVKVAIDRLLKNIPSGEELQKLIGELGKEVKNFDPDKMEFVKKAITWNSGVKDGDIQN